MVNWQNLDKLASFKELAVTEPACLVKEMTGENGAKRVREYSVKMAGGLVYNYAAKAVNDEILGILGKLADEAQLTEKYE